MPKILQTELVTGHCPECEVHTVLVGIHRSIYRCTNCGEETRQYVNGSIKYFKLTEQDREWLKENQYSE